jgi:hypothetical protein
MAHISFSDIEDAFLFVGSASYCEHSAFLNIETGQIFYRSEMGDLDEVDEDNMDWDNTIEIPHKNNLGLGKSLVFDFMEKNLSDDYNLVRDMFRRRGAYSNFKDFLSSKGMLEAWYQFENEREQEALRLWCEENELSLLD